jgi:acyl-CoA reductase-like NAD-dependent aldehyde dehydrogenase
VDRRRVWPDIRDPEPCYRRNPRQRGRGRRRRHQPGCPRARKAFDSGPWSRITPSERGRLIWKIGDLILEYAEIAAEANNTSYGLGAWIWTKDISKAHALAKKLRAGTVWINCYNVFDASLPFGGYKQSGWGREMGHEALEAYTEVKAVTTQL